MSIEHPHTGARRLIASWARRTAQRLDTVVRPIFVPNQRRDPRLVGSGVLLELQGQPFLVTAAHVLDEADGATLNVLGTKDLVEVSGIRHRSEAPAANRANDMIDVGFVPLAKSEVASLRDVRLLNAGEIDPNDSLVRRTSQKRPLYFVLGYPASKTRLNPTKLTLRSGAFRFVGRPASTDVQHALGVEDFSHLTLEFDRARSVGRNGPGVAPDPHGVSGGGAWRCGDILTGDPDECRLVAIMTEWHDKPTNVLLGTSVAFLLAGIGAQFPELAAGLPTVRTLNVNVRTPQGLAPRPPDSD